MVTDYTPTLPPECWIIKMHLYLIGKWGVLNKDFYKSAAKRTERMRHNGRDTIITTLKKLKIPKLLIFSYVIILSKQSSKKGNGLL